MLQSSLVTIVNGRPVISIGSLRHPITIQALGPSSPPNYDQGGVVMAWNTFKSARAAIGAVRGADVVKGGQTTTQLFLEVALWYQAGILANMRVLADTGSTYVIQSVENVLEMNVVLILNCVALGTNE